METKNKRLEGFNCLGWRWLLDHCQLASAIKILIQSLDYQRIKGLFCMKKLEKN